MTSPDDVPVAVVNSQFANRTQRLGNGFKRVREQYLRSDLPCCCMPGLSTTGASAPPGGALSHVAPFFVVPMSSTLDVYMDVIESAIHTMPDMLVLASVMKRMRTLGYSRTIDKVNALLSGAAGASRRIALFADTHFDGLQSWEVDVGGPHANETVTTDRAVRESAVLQALRWVREHMRQVQPGRPIVNLVILTENSDFAKVATEAGFFAYSCSEFLRSPHCEQSHAETQTLVRVCESIETTILEEQMQAVEEEEEGKSQVDGQSPIMHSLDKDTEHWTPARIKEALFQAPSAANGWQVVVAGKLQVSSCCPTEAFVNTSKPVLIPTISTTKSSPTGGTTTKRIFIPSRIHSNRAIHGDIVVVQLLPVQEWVQSRATTMIVNNNNDNSETSTSTSSESGSKSGLNNSSIKTVPTARVVGVMKRNWRPYVVSLSSRDNDNAEHDTNASAAVNSTSFLVVPMDSRVPRIRVRMRAGVSTLRGQRFVVTVDEWTQGSSAPRGHYVRTIGPIGDLSAESSALLHEAGLEAHQRPFSTAALACLPAVAIHTQGDKNKEEWQIPPEEAAKRRDLRSIHNVVSVDPVGCQDIDDAMSIHFLRNEEITVNGKQNNGRKKVVRRRRVFELGVHIADVSFFVKPQTALDREASTRGTSVYLQERRLDMLPALLCEDLCSLRAGVDRLAMSVIWTIHAEEDDRTGTTSFKVVDTWFGRTCIRSRYALAYEQAQRMLDGKEAGIEAVKGAHTGGPVNPKDVDEWLKEALTDLRAVARQRRLDRTSKGGIELEGGEFKFKLNSAARPETVQSKEHLEVHDVIAELMIFANSAVAQQIRQVFPTSALVRKHPKPSPERFEQVMELCKRLGLAFDLSSNESICRCLRDAKSRLTHGQDALLNTLVTRAMTEAQYVCTGHEDDQGDFAHFGLGVEHYTHFTSPIRRYPDVLVHRLLMASLAVKNEVNNTGTNPTRHKPLVLPASIVTDVLDMLKEEDLPTLVRAYLETSGAASNNNNNDPISNEKNGRVQPPTPPGPPPLTSSSKPRVVDELDELLDAGRQTMAGWADGRSGGGSSLFEQGVTTVRDTVNAAAKVSDPLLSAVGTTRTTGQESNGLDDLLFGGTNNTSGKNSSTQDLDILLGGSSTATSLSGGHGGLDDLLGGGGSNVGGGIDDLLGGGGGGSGSLLSKSTLSVGGSALQDDLDALLGSGGSSMVSAKGRASGISQEREVSKNNITKTSETPNPNPTAASNPSPDGAPDVSRVLQRMAEHCNEQHRRAKDASMRSQELFFALYFNANPQIVDALVYKCHENGVMTFVPSYMVKMPLRVVDRLGGVRLARHGMDRAGQNGSSLVLTNTGKRFGDASSCANNFIVDTVSDATVSFNSVKETLQVSRHGVDVLLRVTKSVKAVLVCDFSSSRTRVPKAHLVLLDPSLLVANDRKPTNTSSRAAVRKTVVLNSTSSPLELSGGGLLDDTTSANVYSLLYNTQGNSKNKALSHSKRDKARAGRASLGSGRASFGDVSTFCAKPRRGDQMQLIDMDGSMDWPAAENETGENGFSAMGAQAKKKAISQYTADATRRMAQLAANKRNDKVKRKMKKQQK